MVLRRLLLPRVLVVTALKPVPRVNVVRHAAPGNVGPAVLRRLLLRIVDGHPAGGVVDRGVAVSPGRGTSRLQVMHPFLNSDPRLIRTRTPRLSRNRSVPTKQDSGDSDGNRILQDQKQKLLQDSGAPDYHFY